MAASSPAPRLTDILDAIERIHAEMAGVTIDAFEADWRKRWLVERGVEIISEASRRLPEGLTGCGKSRLRSHAAQVYGPSRA
jgi:uncharacterized protein with HEPN domain